MDAFMWVAIGFPEPFPRALQFANGDPPILQFAGYFRPSGYSWKIFNAMAVRCFHLPAVTWHRDS
jgi:hypothetical protein